MGKMFYYVTVIGVVLQVISGQDSGIKKMEQCPCANEVIEVFLGSVDQNTVDIENGQKLRLRLWQQKKDNCSANFLDKSLKPGRIEISMAYQGSVDIAQGEGEDQYRSDDDEEQQGSIDIGQQLQDEDIRPQQGVDIGVQTEAADSGLLQDVDIQQLLGSVDLDEFKQNLEDFQAQLGLDTEDQEGEDTAEEQGEDIAQEQAGIDSAQRQSGLPNASYLGTEGGDKDYSAVFSFTVDVNTGKLSVDSRPMSKRRKRDIKPFDTVTINIKIDFYKKSDSVVTASDDQIKSLLRKPLGDYWLAMVFCLLDVKQ